MATPEKLTRDAERYNVAQEESNRIIDSKITETKDDFSQFAGMALIAPYTTLQINTGAYNVSANNVMDIAIDGGGTWTTVSAHADLPGGNIYYTAEQKNFDGTAIIPGTIRTINGANAYDMIRNLGIHKILAV